MTTLFLEGGFPMFFLLAFGLAALFFAVRYARSPTPAAVRCTVALGVATFFATLTAIAADLAAIGHHAPAYLKTHPEMSIGEVVLQGVGESMSPAILGFTVLSLTALIATLGAYREGA
jgi:peptidoglycan biosynthesis protein MviN/MurJ (putative lipid II flippase)